MQTIAFVITVIFCFYTSCSEEPLRVVSSEVDHVLEKEKTIHSNNEKNNEILHTVYAELDKPIFSYPIIDHSSVEYRKDGLLYRNGLNLPFTGQVLHKREDGSLFMRCVYYQGVPHGKMERFHHPDLPEMEAVFNRGVLCGTKINWWDNGVLKEEEYWEEGLYLGKSTWDRSGRLIRKEGIPTNSQY